MYGILLLFWIYVLDSPPRSKDIFFKFLNDRGCTPWHWHSRPVPGLRFKNQQPIPYQAAPLCAENVQEMKPEYCPQWYSGTAAATTHSVHQGGYSNPAVTCASINIAEALQNRGTDWIQHCYRYISLPRFYYIFCEILHDLYSIILTQCTKT